MADARHNFTCTSLFASVRHLFGKASASGDHELSIPPGVCFVVPDAPVFRTSNYDLLAQPYDLTYIGTTNVDLVDYYSWQYNSYSEALAALNSTFNLVFAAAAANNIRHVIVGYFGAVHQREVAVRAAYIVASLIRGPWAGCFSRITFAFGAYENHGFVREVFRSELCN
jgi:uncharacterized protein (TIGR02452 family)